MTDARPTRASAATRLLILATTVFAVGGCLDSRAPSPIVPSSGVASPSPSPQPIVRSASPVGPTVAPIAGDLALEATDAGLSLSVTLDHGVVAPGGVVEATVTIRNGRATPVEIGGGWCGGLVDLVAKLPVPAEPVGRTWGGIAGTYKAFAIANATGPGGGPAAADVATHGWAGPGCDQGGETLAPGAVRFETIRWRAELVRGVPAAPGVVPVELDLAHDPEGAPPSRDPNAKGPIGSWFQTWKQLSIHTTIRVEGEAVPVMSIGQAVDAILGDRRFAIWLTTMPARTWSGTNVFLSSNAKAEGIVPAGPAWEVDLFREMGVPRNWAIGFVQPFTGEVRNLTFCNNPCDR